MLPVLENDLGLEGLDISVTISLAPTFGTTEITSSNEVLYSPEAEFTGQDSFTYRICTADELCSSAGVTVTVKTSPEIFTAEASPTSTPPETASPTSENVQTEEPVEIATRIPTGTATEAPSLPADPQPPAEPPHTPSPTATVAADSPAEPTESPVPPTATPFPSPSPTFPPTGTLTVTATTTPDGASPQAAGDYYQLMQDDILQVPAPGLLTNDAGAGGSSVQVVSELVPTHGQLQLHPDGSFAYSPQAGFSGFDHFTYRLETPSGSSTSVLVSIAVLEGEKPLAAWAAPVANGETLDVDREPLVLEVSASDNLGVERVWFYRWDAIQQQYLEIGSADAPPYQVVLEPSLLQAEWNQVFARAQDISGNLSERSFIWLYKPPTPQGLAAFQDILRFYLPGLYH